MARSPYLLKDGSHILSKYAARVGVDCKVFELRVDMNGWRAQHLVHNCGSFASVNADDLSLYAADKKVKAVSHAVDSVLATIRGSVPLAMTRTFDGRLSVTSREQGFGQSVTNAQMLALAEECNALGADKGIFKLTPFFYQATSTQGCMTGMWSKWEQGVNARLLSDHVRNTLSGLDQNSQYFDDPVGSFKSMLSKHLAIPMDQIHFAGRGFPINFWSSPANLAPDWSVYVRTPFSAPGFTVIYSPRDLEGCHGIFVVPKIPGVKLAIIASRLGTRSSVLFRLKSGAYTVPDDIVDASGVVPLSRVANSDNTMTVANEKTPNQCYVVNDVTPVGGVVTSASVGLPSDVHALWGNPALSCKADNGNWGAYTAGCDRSFIRVDGLFYAVPNGFGEILLSAPSVNVVATDADYGNVFAVSPVKVNGTLKMQSIRAYMLAKSKTPGIDPVDAKTLQKGLVESEKYADALLYCTVYHNGWEYPTESEVENLSIVRAAADADKDLMTEDLGEGVTIRKGAQRFAKLRSNGQRAFAAVTMVDDVVSATEVVSPLIADRFLPWLWRVEPVFTDDAIVAYRGYYDGGGAESITSDDALALLANNATLTLPSGLTREQVLADLGVEQGQLPTYASMTFPARPASRNTAYDGMSFVQPMGLAPADFRDVLGFPVLNIVDNDSRYRAMLVFKGLGEDLQGMFLTLFFLNQLDVK